MPEYIFKFHEIKRIVVEERGYAVNALHDHFFSIQGDSKSVVDKRLE